MNENTFLIPITYNKKIENENINNYSPINEINKITTNNNNLNVIFQNNSFFSTLLKEDSNYPIYLKCKLLEDYFINTKYCERKDYQKEFFDFFPKLLDLLFGIDSSTKKSWIYQATTSFNQNLKTTSTTSSREQITNILPKKSNEINSKENIATNKQEVNSFDSLLNLLAPSGNFFKIIFKFSNDSTINYSFPINKLPVIYFFLIILIIF